MDSNNLLAAMTPDETIIPFSKTKLVLAVIGSCALVALCAWLLTFSDDSIRSSSPLLTPLLFRAVMIFGVLFFGLCAILIVKKLFKKGPGLVLNRTGLIDYSTGTTIAWAEILEFKVIQIRSQKMIGIQVADPQKYIESGSARQRMVRKINYKTFGMPVFIMSNALKISFPELVKLLEEYRQKYGNVAHNPIFQSGLIS